MICTFSNIPWILPYTHILYIHIYTYIHIYINLKRFNWRSPVILHLCWFFGRGHLKRRICDSQTLCMWTQTLWDTKSPPLLLRCQMAFGYLFGKFPWATWHVSTQVPTEVLIWVVDLLVGHPAGRWAAWRGSHGAGRVGTADQTPASGQGNSTAQTDHFECSLPYISVISFFFVSFFILFTLKYCGFTSNCKK